MTLRFTSDQEYKRWLSNRIGVIDPTAAPQAKIKASEPLRTNTLKLVIPIRSVSLNDIYGADSWAVRAKIATQVHEQVTWQLQIDGVPRVFFAPRVDVHVDAYFHDHWLDSDNIPIKLMIDGLRSYGILENDDPRFVRRVSSEAHMSDTGRESVAITVKHVKE
jgi:hypothetical protein